MREAQLERNTKETQIVCRVNLDGKGDADIITDVPFLSHMLELFSKFALIDLSLSARGDVEIDIHHTNEDMGIVLGQALDNALGNRKGIARVSSAYVPMDEALSRVVIDFSGRPFLSFNVYVINAQNESGYSFEYAKQFFNALSVHCKANIHIDVLRGDDFHHIMESVFKAFGRAFYNAKQIISNDIPSTKGAID